MSRKTGAIATIVGIALFGAWVWSGVASHTQVECEVCVRFEGRSGCGKARGATRDEARIAAQRNACAPLAGGVTGAFACPRVTPSSLACRNR